MLLCRKFAGVVKVVEKEVPGILGFIDTAVVWRIYRMERMIIREVKGITGLVSTEVAVEVGLKDSGEMYGWAGL